MASAIVTTSGRGKPERRNRDIAVAFPGAAGDRAAGMQRLGALNLAVGVQ